MASKVLLVEDDNNLREIYEARLQAEGYMIVTAKDGEEALAVAKTEKPDLIISDVMMPRISGFEMLDILRNTEELRYTKVIMLTALGQADDKTRANSLGADRYLVKSQVTLEDIVKAAHELTDGPAPAGATAPPTTAPTAMPVNSTPAPAMATPPPVIPVAQAPGAAQQIAPPAPVQPASPVASPPSGPQPAPATIPVAPAAPVPSSATPSITSTAPAAAPNTPLSGPAPRPAYMTDFSAPAAATPAAVAADTSVSQASGAPALNTPTAAEEQAAVGAQIANFIGTPPASTASAIPADSAAQSDEAALATAVNSLVANGQAPAETPVITPSVPIPDATLPPIQQTAASQPANPAAAPSNTVTIANKKVIQPLQREPKPGLDELLAKEEAKTPAQAFGQVTTSPPDTSAVNTAVGQPLPAPHQPGATFMPNATSAAPPMPSPNPAGPPSSGVDPNSIAL